MKLALGSAHAGLAAPLKNRDYVSICVDAD